MAKQPFERGKAWLRQSAHALRVAALAASGCAPAGLTWREWRTLAAGFRSVAGYFLVPRSAGDLPAGVLASMDALYAREAGEHFWAPAPGRARRAEELRFDGPVAIVGKGPSLDRLCEVDFDGCCAVLAINHAIQRVANLDLAQAVYGVQIDTSAGYALAARGTARIVALCAAHLYRADTGKYVFRLGDFVIERVCTAAYAIALARRAGARSLRLLAFDALTDGDLRYAASLHLPAPDSRDWGPQLEAMRAAAASLPIEFKRAGEHP